MWAQPARLAGARKRPGHTLWTDPDDAAAHRGGLTVAVPVKHDTIMTVLRSRSDLINPPKLESGYDTSVSHHIYLVSAA